MRIRNLEAQYDNLHPDHVLDGKGLPGNDYPSLSQAYIKLWEYAKELELDVKKKNKIINDQRNEIRKVHNAIIRKHRRLMIVKEFGRTFAYFKKLSKAFD